MFLFNGINYPQIKGCALGATYAFPYAKCFIGKCKKLHVYHYLRNISTFYYRFIDDIFSYGR